jgi:hypothetical protein
MPTVEAGLALGRHGPRSTDVPPAPRRRVQYRPTGIQRWSSRPPLPGHQIFGPPARSLG